MRAKDFLLEHQRDQTAQLGESDDDMFGSRQQSYMVVAPDNEVLGEFDNPREAIRYANARAKALIPEYLEAGYDSDDNISVLKRTVHDGSIDYDDPGDTVLLIPILEGESDDDLFVSGEASKEKLRGKIERYQQSQYNYAVVAPDGEVLEYFITIDEATQYAIGRAEGYLEAGYRPTDKIKIHSAALQSHRNNMDIGPVQATIALNGTVKTKR
jgi:hypothetical protein